MDGTAGYSLPSGTQEFRNRLGGGGGFDSVIRGVLIP